MSARPAPSPPPAPMVAFVDSSAIIALVDRDDANHTAAIEAYRDLLAAGYRLFTTNHVIVETYDLLSTGVGPAVARRWLQDMRLAIYHATEEDEQAARRLMSRRDGMPRSLTDAISRVVMQRLGVADAFAVDPSVLGEDA